MTALATSPAVIDGYLVAQIDDEMTLAALLGYFRLERPIPSPDFPSLIWGVRRDFVPSWPGAAGRHVLPKWRRSSECFELIARCKLTISTGPTGVSVQSWTGGTPCATVYADHPSEDDAIRFAVCKAAISCLTVKSSTTSPKE